MKRSLVHIFAIVALVVLIVGSSIGADRRYEKKFSVSPGGTFTLATDVGDVEFSGTSSGEVSIVADIRGKQREVDGFDISAWQNSDGVEVKGKSNRSSWFSWFNDGLEVRYTILLPQEYGIHVNTSINAAALQVMPAILQRWLPGGHRKGHEWVALNPRRADQHAGSFKVNIDTGRWADFATGDRGGDPVSLLAYLGACSQLEAARDLATMLGLQKTEVHHG